MRNKPLVFIALNEVNFDLVSRYVKSGDYPGFSKLLEYPNCMTVSEDEYEHLEPWIQWVSVYTGETYKNHKVFRLGDIVKYPRELLFEYIEKSGYRVGCISPINADNRTKNNGYFIPDPWTQTKSDETWWSRKLHYALTFFINNNAEGKITISSALILIFGLINFIRAKNIFLYFNALLLSLKLRWYRALFLDIFLVDIENARRKKEKIDFSFIFLNAGAHIQHHYLFSSKFMDKNGISVIKRDPIEDMLSVYDKLLQGYIQDRSINLIVATGLSQTAYDKNKFYYRLKDHEKFLSEVGIKPLSVRPAMTRDFFAYYINEEEAKNAINILKNIEIRGVLVFGDLQIQNSEIFATFNYPYEISKDDFIKMDGHNINIYNHTVFVAIKNGMHQSLGYAFFSPEIKNIAPKQNSHVSCLNRAVKEYFK
jgi:hypothetical protein